MKKFLQLLVMLAFTACESDSDLYDYTMAAIDYQYPVLKDGEKVSPEELTWHTDVNGKKYATVMRNGQMYIVDDKQLEKYRTRN
jgi:hypothetical protein